MDYNRRTERLDDHGGMDLAGFQKEDHIGPEVEGR